MLLSLYKTVCFLRSRINCGLEIQLYHWNITWIYTQNIRLPNLCTTICWPDFLTKQMHGWESAQFLIFKNHSISRPHDTIEQRNWAGKSSRVNWPPTNQVDRSQHVNYIALWPIFKNSVQCLSSRYHRAKKSGQQFVMCKSVFDQSGQQITECKLRSL